MTDRDDRQNRPDSLADAALDALFAEARAERNTRDTGDLPDLPPGGAEGLPPGLSARILADADTLMDQRASAAAAERAAARAHVPARGFAPGLVPAGAGGMGGAMMPGAGFGPVGFWAQVARAIGGGPALAGLGAITLMGLWLGLMPPTALQSGLESAFGTGLSANPYLVDSTSAFEFLDSEG